MTDKKKHESQGEDELEILKHMTRAEMVSELMMMLNEAKDEDMPALHELIRRAMSKNDFDK